MTQKPTLYSLAARYPNKNSAGKAYDPIQAIIFEEDCDLSAYRFFEQKERKWYVIVIGEGPSPQLQERLATILFSLTRGQRITLDSQTLAALMVRRAEQTQFGPWVERHYHIDQE